MEKTMTSLQAVRPRTRSSPVCTRDSRRSLGRAGEVPGLPLDEPLQCVQLSEEMWEHGGLMGAVGAVDGTLIPMKRPSRTYLAADEQAYHWYCYKEFHAVLLLVVGDARVRYLGLCHAPGCQVHAGMCIQ